MQSTAETYRGLSKLPQEQPGAVSWNTSFDNKQSEHNLLFKPGHFQE